MEVLEKISCQSEGHKLGRKAVKTAKQFVNVNTVKSKITEQKGKIEDAYRVFVVSGQVISSFLGSLIQSMKLGVSIALLNKPVSPDSMWSLSPV